MLIIASTLEFNGVSTFVLRFCRECANQGRRAGVLVLVSNPEPQLLSDLRKCADVYFLSDFMLPIWRLFSKIPLISFFPIKWNEFNGMLLKHKGNVHITGVFGLLLMARCFKIFNLPLRLSVGIYHQNEFMYKSLPYYFANQIQSLFVAVGAARTIFFNDANIRAYSNFFDENYSKSTIVPIGIELPSEHSSVVHDPKSKRIVSIGNLYDFKSYNLHVINNLPGLLKIDPSIRYEIYGEGPNHNVLIERAKFLGVLDSVEFKGRVPYSTLPNILSGALVFVGSGTALVEAAALGVPALIGIESTNQAVTYGFLCDIDGFSYNEYEEGRYTTSMRDKILAIFQNADEWRLVSYRCAEKARLFSMKETVKGLDSNFSTAAQIDANFAGGYSSIRALLSLSYCGFLQVVGVDARFSTRRNQGTLP
jgi:1,2-diacylglycerol 3-alpha-glucosyltransferase